MKSPCSIFLSISALALFSVCGAQSLQAANEWTIQSEAATQLYSNASGFPGFSLGFAAAGAPVTNFVPCFGVNCTPRTRSKVLEINEPLSILTAGQNVQLYFTAQTTTFSGDVTVTVRILQNLIPVATLLSGTLPLDANENYVIYGTALTQIPTSVPSGHSTIEAVANTGTAISRAYYEVYIQ